VALDKTNDRADYSKIDHRSFVRSVPTPISITPIYGDRYQVTISTMIGAFSNNHEFTWLINIHELNTAAKMGLKRSFNHHWPNPSWR